MSLFRKKKAPAPNITPPPVTERSALRMKVVHPEKFADAPLIADELIAGRTVILDLAGMEREAGRLLLNFISGVSYALDGSIKRIAEHATFLVTPSNVDVAPEEAEEALRRSPAVAPAQKPEPAAPVPPADPVAAMFTAPDEEED